jgi:hypothetical protein
MTYWLRTVRWAATAVVAARVVLGVDALAQQAVESPPEVLAEFDVVIAGGTTAALAAAVAACDEGARVALIEPTDWPGGQLTSSGVPAVDEAWHRLVDPASKAVLLNVAEAARDPRNMSPLFRDMLARNGKGGNGWVSRFCFEPKHLLKTEIEPLLAARRDRLTVFRNAVVKSVDANDRAITAITIIERTPRQGVKWGGYDRLPSEDLADWYDPRRSERFDKRVLRFENARKSANSMVFIDATEWGEVLALAGAPYLQGVEEVDGELEGNDRCGQSTVFGFVEQLTAKPAEEPARDLDVGHLGFGDYVGRDDAWQQIWTYRRIRGREPGPHVGDLSLQNWGYSRSRKEGGNDYPFGYLFKSKADAEAERADWRGGIDPTVLAAAEQRALAWHEWFKAHAPAPFKPEQVSLAVGVLGTGHGLSKLPYIRDTRRSVGLDGFVLKFADLSGPAAQREGTKFPDRVALGAYAADIHALASCEYPSFAEHPGDTLPFYVPFRALTNRQFGNLLVAGKTMAQTFVANSATRLHPIEWSSGTAAGVAAAEMSRSSSSSSELLTRVGELQLRVKAKQPIDWTFNP